MNKYETALAHIKGKTGLLTDYEILKELVIQLNKIEKVVDTSLCLVNPKSHFDGLVKIKQILNGS